MKFLIKDNPISYDEIYGAIRSYMQENHGMRPSYMLIHPETRHKIMISSNDEMLGISYQVISMHPAKRHEEIKYVHEMFGLALLQSEDVEPGFVIICG